MYHAHFGLEKGLFGEGIAAETAVFRSPHHDRLASQFKLALGSPSSAIVLRGPAGVGKTTFTSSTLRASTTRLALAWLNGTATNASELLELILAELGIAPARASRIERLQLWRQFHGEMRATDSRLFVIAERTEDLSVEVLHALDQLTAPDAAGNVGANLVLLGHPDIDEHLAAPLLDSLRQRIRLKAELEPFTEAELQDYLRHQVACVRGHYDHVFAPGTVAALHRFSAGVARLANTLCETALELAASEKHKLLTAELVTRTAVSLLGLADTTALARSPSPEPMASPSAAKLPPAQPAAPVPAPPVQARVAPPAPATPAPAIVASAAPVTAPRTTAPAPAAATVPAAVSAPAPVATPPPAVATVAAPVGAQPPAAVIPTAPAPRAPVPVPPRAAAPAPPPPPVPAPVAAPETAPSMTLEFDGGATDVTDVDIMDFPVLTDAVDPSEPIFVKRTVAVTPPAPIPASAAAAPRTPTPARPAVAEPPVAPAKPAAAPRVQPPAVAPAAQKPASATPSRVETAYTSKATTTAAAPKAAPALPVPSSIDLADDDLLRQTQTMRAIAVAKSIDDISSSMAETLFGDAELDLVAAALASAAADWPDDSEAKPTAVPAEPKAAKTPPKVDDPFDIFDLGDDAPLELIDDSLPPPAGQPRKTAAR